MDIPYLLLKSDSYETREVPESHFFHVVQDIVKSDSLAWLADKTNQYRSMSYERTLHA